MRITDKVLNSFVDSLNEKTKNNLAGSDSAAPSVASLQTDYKVRVDVLAIGLVYSF